MRWGDLLEAGNVAFMALSWTGQDLMKNSPFLSFLKLVGLLGVSYGLLPLVGPPDLDLEEALPDGWVVDASWSGG